MTVLTSDRVRPTSNSAQLQVDAVWSWGGNQGLTDVFMVPLDLLDRYVLVAMRSAEPRKLENGQWYADLRGFPGIWAAAGSPKECLDELDEVLREWIFVKLVDGDRDIPLVDDIDLTCLLNQR